jgi:hypothetical protein
MIVLRDPAQLAAPYEPFVSALLMTSLSTVLAQRFRDMSDGDFYDPEEHGYIVIAEPGDDPKTLDEGTGCPIFSDWFGDSRYPEAGFAVLLIVPKLTGIDQQLLNLCRENVEQKVA